MRTKSLRFRSYLLPLVLAALSARALLPAGLIASSDAMVKQSPMCSAQKDRLERIELTGEHSMPCFEHCVPPLSGPPIAMLRVDAPVTGARRIAAHFNSQRSHAPLLRTQIPRAPPQA